MHSDVMALLDLLVEAELRRRLARGEYIRPLAGPLVSYGWLLAYCRRRGIRSRNCHYTAEKRERALMAVVEEGLPIRAAAEAIGMSRSSVHRVVMRERRAITNSVDRIGFETVAAYRCPQHGMVTISPCPACAAGG